MMHRDLLLLNQKLTSQIQSSALYGVIKKSLKRISSVVFFMVRHNRYHAIYHAGLTIQLSLAQMQKLTNLLIQSTKQTQNIQQKAKLQNAIDRSIKKSKCITTKTQN
jgi:hypothetical protein